MVTDPPERFVPNVDELIFDGEGVHELNVYIPGAVKELTLADVSAEEIVILIGSNKSSPAFPLIALRSVKPSKAKYFPDTSTRPPSPNVVPPRTLACP